MVNGIDLSDLILIFFSFEMRTFMMGSLDANIGEVWKTQKPIMPIRQILYGILSVLDTTLFEKQILSLP